MNVFYHVTEIRGTFYENTMEIGMIEGVDAKLDTPMTPDTDILFKRITGTAVAVPTITNILAFTIITDINNLTNGTTNSKLRNFIPITPFLCHAISKLIDKRLGEIKKILPALVLAINNFDTKHDGDIEYLQKAKQNKIKESGFYPGRRVPCVRI